MADKIQFTIAWDGNVTAQLVELTDNGALKVGEADQRKGPGKITVSYEAEHFHSHEIKWTLWSLVHEIRNIKATAAVNGGAEKSLKAKADATSTWTDSDVVRS